MDPTSPHPARDEQPPRGFPPNRGPAYEGSHAYGGGPSGYYYGPPYGYYPPPPGYAAPGYPAGGSSSGYPMQQAQRGEASGRVKSPPSHSPFPGGRGSHGRHQSPLSRREGPKSSPEAPGSADAPRSSPASIGSAINSTNNKLADEIETERLRQAALTDVTPEKVTPIKTAFHFFVLDVREQLRALAEAEVRKTTQNRSSEPLDSYLLNSNMNCRLMKAWEELSDEQRGGLLTREEADRRRFMEEEEIASRHCATLTARSKSPKTPERRSSDRSAMNPSPSNAGTLGPSPSPISRLKVDPPSDEKKFDDPQHEPHEAPPTRIKGHVSPQKQQGEPKDKTPKPKDDDRTTGGADTKNSTAKSEVFEDKEDKTEKVPTPPAIEEVSKEEDPEESDAKSKGNTAAAADDDTEEDKETLSAKRPSPEKGGSPPKRNRVDGEDPSSDS